jgi:hypothetical protein
MTCSFLVMLGVLGFADMGRGSAAPLRRVGRQDVVVEILRRELLRMTDFWVDFASTGRWHESDTWKIDKG